MADQPASGTAAAESTEPDELEETGAKKARTKGAKKPAKKSFKAKSKDEKTDTKAKSRKDAKPKSEKDAKPKSKAKKDSKADKPAESTADEADDEENLPQSFREFDLSPELLARLDELGFVKPTPIQQKTIAQGLAGRDIMGKAETGTGKTLAFTLPILEPSTPPAPSPTP